MLNVLLIEDEEAFGGVLKKILERKNYNVTIASDGISAQNILGANQFDLILSDICLPKLSGTDLLRWHKASGYGKPFFLMTGFSEILEVNQADALGASGFLTKPFKEEELFSLLDRALNQNDNPLEALKISGEKDHDFFRINIDDFISGKAMPCGIYIRLGCDRFVKIAHSDQEINISQIQRYKSKSVGHLYMRRDEYQAYVALTLKIGKFAAGSDKIPVEKKQKLLKHISDVILEKAFIGGMKEDDFLQARIFTEITLSVVAEDPNVFKLLETLSQRGDDLYAHSLGVSVYAVMVAQAMRWAAPTTLYKVALSGLYHDIGKKEIDPVILKKSRLDLTASDVAIFETHPMRGMEILRSIKSVPSDVIDVAGQHHEMNTGQGYPCRLNKTKIHPLAKLISVVDNFCYYALAGANSEGMPAPLAFEKLSAFHGRDLDEAMMNALSGLINK